MGSDEESVQDSIKDTEKYQGILSQVAGSPNLHAHGHKQMLIIQNVKLHIRDNVYYKTQIGRKSILFTSFVKHTSKTFQLL